MTDQSPIVSPHDQSMIGGKVLEQIERMRRLDRVGGDTCCARFFLTIDDEEYTAFVHKGRFERGDHLNKDRDAE